MMVKTTSESASSHIPNIEYMNIFGNINRFIDLSRLQQDDWVLPQLFDQLIQNKKLDLSFTVSQELDTELKNIVYELRNLQKHNANYHTCIGFPFFKGVDSNSNIIFAPAFLWEVGIEQIYSHPYQWKLTHNYNFKAYENIALFNYIKKNYQVDLCDFLRQKTVDRNLSSGVIQGVVHQILSKFGSNFSSELPIERIKVINISDNNPIQWNAILGIFPTQQISILQKQNFSKPEPLFSEQLQINLPFYPFDANYEQKRVIESLQDLFPKVMVLGDASSGKTHTVANLLAVAIANKKTCLVVSSNINGLLKIQKMLSEKNLEALQLLLRNPDFDKLIFLELIKATINQTLGKFNFDEKNFTKHTHNLLRVKQHLDNGYSNMFQNIFGDEHWRSVMAHYLTANSKVGKELLLNSLDENQYTFNKENYIQLKNIVLDSQLYYKNINTLYHPLQRLHPTHFIHNDAPASLAQVIEKLSELHKKSIRVQHNLLAVIDQYSDSLKDAGTHFYKISKKHGSDILDQIRLANELHGKRFVDTNKGWAPLFAVFSKKYKSLNLSFQELYQQIQQLIELHNVNNFFDYTFITPREISSLSDAKLFIEKYLVKLEGWNRQFNAQIHSEITRLNSKTDRVKLGHTLQIIEIENEITTFVTNFNQAKLYANPIEDPMLTLSNKQFLLEGLLGKLDETKNSLKEYQHFYTWHRHWLRLSEPQQQLIKTIIKVRPTDWLAAFESWFYYNLLAQKFVTDMPSETSDLENYQHYLDEYNLYANTNILRVWREQQKNALTKIKKNQPKVYDVITGKKSTALAEKNLPQLIELIGLEQLTTFFPIILVSPESATELFDWQKKQFDILIIDDAHLIPSEKIKPLIPIANKLYLFGNSDNNSTEKSVLNDNEIKEGVKTVTLKQIFNNNPFQYAKSLYTTNQAPAFQSVQDNFGTDVQIMMLLNGIFDDNLLTNFEEANKVIDLLLNLNWQKRIYPSVSVACTTRQQRNLIYSMLNDIKQKRSGESELILQLERNGLGVYTLDELAFVQSDILILSVVFGRNEHGSFTPEIEYLNSPEGKKGVEILFQQTAQKVIVCHSIPISEMNIMLQHQSKSGTYSLANFIAGNRLAYNKITNHPILTDTHFSEADNERLTANFYSAVAESLRMYLPENSIVTNEVADDIVLPLVVYSIKNANTKYMIKADGVFHESVPIPYEWELKLNKRLHQLNYKIIDTFSVDWWRNSNEEAKRLANVIFEMES